MALGKLFTVVLKSGLTKKFLKSFLLPNLKIKLKEIFLNASITQADQYRASNKRKVNNNAMILIMQFLYCSIFNIEGSKVLADANIIVTIYQIISMTQEASQ